MTNQTLLTFPCFFPIKVIGINQDDLLNDIYNIVRQYYTDFNPKTDASTRLSSNNKYLSITVTIVATSKKQLDGIYQEINAHNLVKATL